MVGFLLQVCERYYSLEEIHENNARCHHILLIRKGHFFCLYIRDHKPHSLFLSPQHLRASAWISSSNSPCKNVFLTFNCSISGFILPTMLRTIRMDVHFTTGAKISSKSGLISRCIAVFSSFHLVDPFVF